MTKIKICGITTLQDVEYLNTYKPDFAGFVMFFPKSKRNITSDTARVLLNKLDSSIKSVAVMVSPTCEQIKTAENCGFDYVQIHGELNREVIDCAKIPILRAFNVTNMQEFEIYKSDDKIAGFVFDAVTPGSGKTFDWSLVPKIPNSGKIILLAGGLTPNNVRNAIDAIHPYGVDVSTGVENDNANGKNKDKIKMFIENVRKK